MVPRTDVTPILDINPYHTKLHTYSSGTAAHSSSGGSIPSRIGSGTGGCAVRCSGAVCLRHQTAQT